MAKYLRLSVFGVLLIGVLAFAPAANASFLVSVCPEGTGPGGSTAPGDTVFPCDATGISPGTLVASTSVPFTGTTATGVVVYGGTLISAVYRNSSGTLDFYYQVINNLTAGTTTGTTGCGHGGGQAGCDPIARETDFSFATWLTQLDFRHDMAGFGPFTTTGTVPPMTGDRNSPGGDTVGFSFTPPDAAKIAPGMTSNILIISTNATNFKLGSSSVIDGAVATVMTFEPSSAVPEPGPLALIGGGLLALAGIRRGISGRKR